MLMSFDLIPFSDNTTLIIEEDPPDLLIYWLRDGRLS